MKHIKVLLAFALLLSITLPLQAQKFLKKELMTESDGYRWYRYYYIVGNDTLQAAFNLSGERITPNSLRVFYYTYRDQNTPLPKLFLCWEWKVPIGRDARGAIHYGEVMSIYNRQGMCIIPADLEYNSVSVACDNWLIHCNNYRYSGGEQESYNEKTVSYDGRYYTDGFCFDASEFDKHKKPNPYISTGTSTTTQPQQPVQQQQPTPQPQPTPQRQPQPMQVWVPCSACNGSGQCHVCLGGGTSLINPNSTCFLCSGTGRCTHCAGQGGHNEIQYR